MDKKADSLPAWFTKRQQAADGSIWLDVRLMDPSEGTTHWLKQFDRTVIAPTSRVEASINASHIMAAFELADT